MTGLDTNVLVRFAVADDSEQSRKVYELFQFLSMEQIIFENQEAVEQALRVYSTGSAGFSDCLIERAGHLAGCTSTVTFDKRAARAAGMKLL